MFNEFVYFFVGIPLENRTAIQKSPTRMIGAFPHMTFGSCPKMWFFIDAAFKPIPTFRIDNK
jgi:hypothetical protein